MIFDISIPLTNKTAVYPNNPKVVIVSHQKMPKDSSNSSKITLGSHVGTHIDSSLHIKNKAGSVDKISLDKLVGSCRVLDMSKVKEKITVADFKNHGGVKKGERILVKTGNSARGFKKFYKDYIYLDGEAADYLANKRITLFGIDAWSVKQRSGKDLRAHASLLQNDIVVLEGLDLSRPKAGRYKLAALPLKVIGVDGAPVRAILIN